MAYEAPSQAEADFEVNDEQRLAASDTSRSGAAKEDERLDFFIKRDGVEYAGMHLLIDLWNASRLDDPDHVESSLVAAAQAAGATVLSADFHLFTPNDGVSGVVVLAESHISIHTWPERNFAALDVFMCGDCNPLDTIEVLKDAFAPERIQLNEVRRGLTL